MKATVTASFDSVKNNIVMEGVKKTIVMEGANVDYCITEDILVVTSDKHVEFPERRITIPVNRVLMIEEEN